VGDQTDASSTVVYGSWLMGEVVLTEIDGPVAMVRFHRPERYNAVTAEMTDQLYGALVRLADDDTVQVIILTGTGRSFCPGADLSAVGSTPTGYVDRRTLHASVLLHEMPQVTLAAVNGACAGAGLTWAAACDLRFTCQSAKFNSAFLDVAVAGDMGGFWTLPRILGAARAREMHFLKGKFDAAEALRLGFVSEVWPDDALMGRVTALATDLASKDARALRLAKANFVAAERMTFADFIDLETERHLALFTGDAAASTIQALQRKGRAVSGSSRHEPDTS
jgi:2-(1,2-epoxy-1,2-dihydrophenyl)acetyl-CoA isomerase